MLLLETPSTAHYLAPIILKKHTSIYGVFYKASQLTSIQCRG